MIDEHVIRIIEDHALVEEFLIHLAWCLKNGKHIPERVPTLNDGMVMDALGDICQRLIDDEA